MKRIAGLFWSQTEDERRSILAGGNLFFGALLGAHLGTMDQLPLDDYVRLMVVLAGAVTGLFLVAASKRQAAIWITLAIYAVILTVILLSPELYPAQIRDEIQRIVVMLAVWLAFLVLVRIMPVVPDEEGAAGRPLRMDEEA